MNIVQAEENLKKITSKFSKESFIYDLLGAYDFPKSTISKLKIKLKKNPDDDVVIPSKLHFVAVSKKELDVKFDELLKNYSTVKKQPRFIVVTDYQTIKAYDTKMGEKLDTEIKILSKHPDFFLPWAGIEKKVFQGENPADVKAAEKLAKFFDLILQDNIKLVEKNRHALNVFLTRILFCFFAEDTDIFEKDLFTKSINDHTNKDGNDLADYLQRLFEVLNKKSRVGLPDYLKEFPYVNGGLFAEEFPIPKFSKRSRESLIDLGSDLNWAEINPDIFGSMIQAVVHPDQRAGLGMHYTSVTNIMKVIEPLFLSELKEEFVNAKGSKAKLKKLLERISNIKIFDPACGSGNFLIIAYKELRLLEMDILKVLGEIPMSGISLSNFYGIEIDDFAHEVAKLSLWLAEHQMDVLFNREFGSVKASLPLKETGRIICGNATQTDWTRICKKSNEDEVYVLGNPPYLGFSMQESSHKEDILSVWGEPNKLDYISCWFKKASEYIKNSNAEFAFVSTNSVCQGEQVEEMWPTIFSSGLEITFCHKSFLWNNSAKSKAAVFCIIVGLSTKEKRKNKFIFTANKSRSVSKINAYLTSGDETIVKKCQEVLFGQFPPMVLGNMPKDGGALFLTEEERATLLKKHPEAKKYIRKCLGSQEFLNGITQYCIWVNEEESDTASKIPFLKDRFEKVKKMRLESPKGGTRDYSKKPYRFVEIRHQEKISIIMPRVSSERRDYIPIGYLDKDVIVKDLAYAVYDASEVLFALLTSRMHMAWVRAVAGRLKNDYRYSSLICYNTFPFVDISKENEERLKHLVYQLLSEREKHSGKTLANLYDPDIMPKEILRIHQDIDALVDSCYRTKGFDSDDERLEFLLKAYKNKVEKKS